MLLGGLDVSIAKIQVKGCTGAVPVHGGSHVGAASIGRPAGRLCPDPAVITSSQRALRLEIPFRQYGTADCGPALPLERARRLLQNIAAPEEQHEGHKRTGRNHRIGDDTE
jgi:hypothetical protein